MLQFRVVKGPYKDVRKILLQRSSGGVLPLKRLEFGATARQPSADSILYSEMSRF